jgi:iron complex outermembrane recepter protein
MKALTLPMAVGLALCAVRGLAAENAAELEEVIVTAHRMFAPGAGSERLDPKRLARERARTSDTARMLEALPGVSAYGAGGVSSLPSIRGLADERLRTQVDGMDLVAACPNHMNPPLSYIDPTSVADVDVYPGATPVSVGGDSIGGTIIVRSADPTFAEPGSSVADGAVGAFYRSAGDGWGGNLSATYATEHWSLGYSGAYADSDDYRAGGNFKDYTFTGRPGHSLARDEVGSTYYESTNQSVRVAWTTGRHLVDFTYSYQDVPQEGFPNQRMDLTGNTASVYNLAYTGALDWGTLKARAYYQDTSHEMDFGDDKRYWYGAASGGMSIDGAACSPISATCAAGMPMKSDGENTGVSVDAAIRLRGEDLLRVGAEFQGYRLNDWWPPSGSGMWPYEFINLNDGQRDRYAVFGEWEVRDDRWTSILGVRFESVVMDAGRVHGYDTDTYPTGGTGGSGNQTRDAALFNTSHRHRTDANWDFSWIARYAPAATQDYEFGVAQKTRSPGLYERYTWSSWQMSAFMNNFVGDGNGYFGDVGLDPEVARTVSATADWHDDAGTRWSVRVTPYWSKVDDYIDAIQWDSATNTPRTTPVVDAFTVLRYRNQSATLYGVDFSGTALLATSGRVGRYTATVTGSYARGENDDTNDNLYNIMPLNATVTLAQDLGGWHNAIVGEFVGAKSDVSRVRNEMHTAGYGLIHLLSRYERDTWSVELGIDNLLDRDYDAPLGGAYVGQGTTMMVPMPPNEPQWGTPVPGTGRSFYAGVRYGF